jgi:hypothetical protein
MPDACARRNRPEDCSRFIAGKGVMRGDLSIRRWIPRGVSLSPLRQVLLSQRDRSAREVTSDL